MHTSVKHALESFSVQRQLEQVAPGQCAVLVRELAVLLEEAAQLGHVELGSLGGRIVCLFELGREVLVDRVVKLFCCDDTAICGIYRVVSGGS